MDTLPYRRQQVTPRSGGRIAGDRRNHAGRDSARVRAGHRSAQTDYDIDYLTTGNVALQPQPRQVEASVAVRADRAVSPERSVDTSDQLRVAPPAPVTAPRAPFVALILAVVVAGVLGILVLNTRINQNAFHLEKLRDQQRELDLRQQQLTEDLALAESPNSLAAAARRLGLVPAGTPAFIQLPDGRKLGVPQPAPGEQSASVPR
jgi:hypothetical protein